MKTTNVDLRKYRRAIVDVDDAPLFDEAIKAGRSGALRSSYIMIWLACAESLKRRFRLASQRDAAAGRIVGEIEARESDQRAVDKYVLDQAKDYGLVSQACHSTLGHIYEKRCLYAHPYEEAPQPEQVYSAASEVVDCVLGQPVQLGHGYADLIIRNLIDDRSFLNDAADTVSRYADEIVPRISPGVLPRMFDKYWRQLEEFAHDPAMQIFLRRGTWFSRRALSLCGLDLFDEHEWLQKARQYPTVVSEVFADPDLFKELQGFPGDYIINAALQEATTDALYLKKIERLYIAGVMSDAQTIRFERRVSEMSVVTLLEGQIHVCVCYPRLIQAFQSHNWYTQNPAMDLVVGNGPEALLGLDVEQQVELGRNILQSADGKARSAVRFLSRLSHKIGLWPKALMQGITLECFVNERSEIRFKERQLTSVATILEKMDHKESRMIVDLVADEIRGGTFSEFVTSDECAEIKLILDNFAVMSNIGTSIENKVAETFENEIKQ